MRLLLFSLTVLPAIFHALSVINTGPFHHRHHFMSRGDNSFQFLGGPGDMENDLTTFQEFAQFYVKLFEDVIRKKTAEALQTHNNYVDIQMFFNECNAQQYENYGMFVNWLQQFAAFHDDPIIKIMDIRAGAKKGEMILNVDVQAQFFYRQNFDMKVSAVNEDGLGWKIYLVDRSLGCH